MPILTHKCPHCLTEHVALRVLANNATFEDFVFITHMMCPKCRMPAAAKVRRSPQPTRALDGGDHELLDEGGWTVVNFWPAVPAPEIPKHLQTSIERVYLQ